MYLIGVTGASGSCFPAIRRPGGSMISSPTAAARTTA